MQRNNSFVTFVACNKQHATSTSGDRNNTVGRGLLAAILEQAGATELRQQRRRGIDDGKEN
jgi:hypothetical protein